MRGLWQAARRRQRRTPGRCVLDARRRTERGRLPTGGGRDPDARATVPVADERDAGPIRRPRRVKVVAWACADATRRAAGRRHDEDAEARCGPPVEGNRAAVGRPGREAFGRLTARQTMLSSCRVAREDVPVPAAEGRERELRAVRRQEGSSDRPRAVVRRLGWPPRTSTAYRAPARVKATEVPSRDQDGSASRRSWVSCAGALPSSEETTSPVGPANAILVPSGDHAGSSRRAAVARTCSPAAAATSSSRVRRDVV